MLVLVLLGLGFGSVSFHTRRCGFCVEMAATAASTSQGTTERRPDSVLHMQEQALGSGGGPDDGHGSSDSGRQADRQIDRQADRQMAQSAGPPSDTYGFRETNSIIPGSWNW